MRYTTEEQSKTSNNLPLVSIGIPTYNGEQRIVSTVMSIMNQGYPNIELIISDNCSSDKTETVCIELSKKYSLIRYFRQKENIGIIRNFEFVLSRAAGELFMWIADDDWLEPDSLNKYVDFLTSHSNYSIVSGEIQYWTGRRAEFLEKGFSIEHNSPNLRVISYYSKVKHGAIFYGLMPTKIAKQITLQNRMGEDWHFVAKAVYLGKIKMLNCPAYHKKLNGSSKTLKHYAKIIGASWFSAHFPHIKIALDAFFEIMTSSFYNTKGLHSRFALAIGACAGILFNHYFREYPFIVAGKIRRLLGIKKEIRKSMSSWRKELVP